MTTLYAIVDREPLHGEPLSSPRVAAAINADLTGRLNPRTHLLHMVAAMGYAAEDVQIISATAPNPPILYHQLPLF